MAEYYVTYMCVYSDIVEADSPEEAADMVERDCPYDIDGPAHVTNINTAEEWDI